MKLTNYSVQKDLYEFTNTPTDDIYMELNGEGTGHWLCRKIENGVILYPYNTLEALDADYKTVKKI